MSKLRKKPTGLNMGFENIVLLNEFQEEIDVPPVIKTPLGNYLIVYSKLDTVLLSPEIFGAWSARHGATGFAALDEDVEEVEEPLFCLRFASEILSTQADKTLGAASVEVDTNEPTLADSVEQEKVAPVEESKDSPKEVVSEHENLVCEYNRAPPIALLSDDPLDIGPLLKGAGVLTEAEYHRYYTQVGRGLTACNTVGHVHVSNGRNVFYQWDKGPVTFNEGHRYLSFEEVRAPDRPKDPCASNGIPLVTWALPHQWNANGFPREVLHQNPIEWDFKMQRVRLKLREFEPNFTNLVKTLDKDSVKYALSLTEGVYVFRRSGLVSQNRLRSRQNPLQRALSVRLQDPPSWWSNEDPVTPGL